MPEEVVEAPSEEGKVTETETSEEKVEAQVSEQKEEKIDEDKSVEDVDYKAESEKWKKSYDEKRKHFDRLISKKEAENQQLRAQISAAPGLAKKESGFTRKSPVELAELQIRDPKEYQKYVKDEEEYLIGTVTSALKAEKAREEEAKQLLDIRNNLYKDYPQLNPDDENFDKAVYDEVNSFMIANKMSIHQAKIAADYLNVMKEAKKKVEQAKEDAIRTVKKKEVENIVEKPNKVDPEKPEVDPKAGEWADRLGVSRDKLDEKVEGFNI